jgi:hypothetical protein
MPAKYTPEQYEAAFWSFVDKNGPTPSHRPELGPCWLWVGFVRKQGRGYGQFNPFPGKAAHRASWTLAYGAIPAGLYVCHRCDVRICVRPNHLFLGSQSDNMRDAKRKGRAYVDVDQVGVKNGRAILSEDQVREIRRRNAHGERGVDLAVAFGVAASTISAVTHRANWRHVR